MKRDSKGGFITSSRREPKWEKWEQLHFKELESFRCFWKCLRCPFPNEDCIWDDPSFPLDVYEYPPHFFWRAQNENLVRPKPEDPTVCRCPRCFSTRIDIGYSYIKCLNCRYNEPLIDFPISHYYHLAMTKEEEK